jgi:thiamine biosynthesis lipoprotein
MELDPGGIGKGFAVDAAVLILRSHHIAAALISAGSSTLYALGHPPAQSGWKVVVPGLGADSAGISAVRLRDTSLSSANCNEKHFTVDGHLYCHIMDPRTLRPVEGRVHVSIIDPSATTSDALSNVLFVDTPAQSQTFLRHYAPEARAIIVSGTAAAPHCSTYRWRSTIDASRCPSDKLSPSFLVRGRCRVAGGTLPRPLIPRLLGWSMKPSGRHREFRLGYWAVKDCWVPGAAA